MAPLPDALNDKVIPTVQSTIIFNQETIFMLVILDSSALKRKSFNTDRSLICSFYFKNRGTALYSFKTSPNQVDL